MSHHHTNLPELSRREVNWKDLFFRLCLCPTLGGGAYRSTNFPLPCPPGCPVPWSPDDPSGEGHRQSHPRCCRQGLGAPPPGREGGSDRIRRCGLRPGPAEGRLAPEDRGMDWPSCPRGGMLIVPRKAVSSPDSLSWAPTCWPTLVSITQVTGPTTHTNTSIQAGSEPGVTQDT